jgi:peptidoglycan/xylan/chitin deacetylase (PgdA/CDA1 family)
MIQNPSPYSSKKIALRMDDVGASSKKWEVYSKRWFGLGNFLLLKRLPYFRAWGPYTELTATHWESIINMLDAYGAKLTVAVTASWVEFNGTLVPYPKKWPDAFGALKQGVKKGCIRIACHGLTHCVLEDRAFLPKLFTSNRSFHREFWDWVPAETHRRHLSQAKKILEDAFDAPVTILVPPGNVFSEDTLSSASELGFSLVNCNTQRIQNDGLRILGNEEVSAFHDRELILYGIDWLEQHLNSLSGRNFVFVDEL